MTIGVGTSCDVVGADQVDYVTIQYLRKGGYDGWVEAIKQNVMQDIGLNERKDNIHVMREPIVSSHRVT